MRDPDSTQTNMNSGNKKNEQIRFVKPCPGEVSDEMPVEAEIDSSIADLETPQFFIRTYDNTGALKSEIPLKKYTPVYVGRALGCHIDLIEPSISRRHCAFQYKELIIDSLGNTVSGFMIYDLKSSHGTFLNEKRIPSMENIKLKHNDKITFGLSTTVFRFWDSKHQESETSTKTVQQESDDALLRQQPSSTSQAEETRNDADSWFTRYMKVFDQITELTKEFDEQGVQIPDGPKAVSRKFIQQNTKFVNQAQAMSALVAGLIGNEVSEPVVKRRRKRKSDKDEIVVEKEQPVRKRGRRKVEKVVETVPVPPKKGRKRRDSQKIDQQKLAEEVQKQIQTQSNLFQTSSDYLLNPIPSYNGMFLDENDPLSIINGPLLQSNDEESDANFTQPDLALQTGPINIANTVNSAIPDPKMPNLEEVERSVDQIPKKRRGRAPKVTQANSNDAPAITLASVPPPPVKGRRRGRQPKANKSDIYENPVEINPQITQEVVNEPTKRGKRGGRKPNSAKTTTKPLQPIENNSIKRSRKKKTSDVTINQSSELISSTKEPLTASNINNSNFSLLTSTMKKSFVLLRKLEFVQSPEGKTTPIGLDGNIFCRF